MSTSHWKTSRTLCEPVSTDTHAFIWFVENDDRLGEAARSAIEDPLSQVFLSVASVWELSIKASLGKIKLTSPVQQFVKRSTEADNIVLLPIGLRAVAGVEALPFHHRDPFDRLLISEAQTRGLVLVSRDAAFDAYRVQRLW